MTKPLLFALTMILSSTYCQLERAGLGGATSDLVLDGGVRRGSGAGLDGAGAHDSLVQVGRLDGAGNPSSTDSAMASAAGGASGTEAPTPTGGLAIPVTGPTADGPVADGLLTGGAADGPAAGGGTASTTSAGSTGGSPSQASTPTPVSTGGRTSPGTANPPDAAVAVADASPAGDAAPATPRLVWSDEFDGEANGRADATKWAYVTWAPGQVNSEKQQYTNRTSNAFLDGRGNLVLRALRAEDKLYTSARLDTKGKFSLRTGRVEVRAKLPDARGSAPGITLVGTSGTWPDSGALALMEQGGQDKSWFFASAYAGGASGDTGHIRYDFKDAITASADFHVYSLDWYPDGVVFQVDGNNVTSTNYDATSPFASIPESVVLYLAVGGDLGGEVDTKAFPMDMVIDYVRVFAF